MDDQMDAVIEDDVNIAVPKPTHNPEHCPPPAVLVPESAYVSSRYNMNHEKMGIALVINNTFPDHLKTGLRERVGSVNDCKKIVSLLQVLGFEVRLLDQNLTSAEMLSQVNKVATETDYDKMNCFICVILSYGEQSFVYGTDRRIEVDRLVQPFKGDKCPKLAGKPKLFFLQTCPIQYAIPGTVPQGQGDDDEKKIPIEGDLFIVQSCVPGHLTWNDDPSKLSLFIDALVSVIINKRHECDLMTMMTRVLRKLFNALESFEERHRRLPYVTSTLYRDLYFHSEQN